MTSIAVPMLQEYDPLKDRSYRDAKLGPDVVAFLAWLELGGAAPRTIGDYEDALARFCRMYPRTRLEDITDEQLGQVWRRFPERSRSTRTAPYRKMFKWAMQTRRIDTNPIDRMPDIRRPRKGQFDIFSDAEIELLLGLPIIDAAPLGLFFEAGVRQGEARQMTLRRCAPGSDAVKVLKGKGGKDRRIPMSLRLSSLLADLEILEGVGPDDYLLYGVTANSASRRVVRRSPAGTGTFYRWWRKCLDEAGVRYRNPHMARHTCATRWRRQGHAIDDISDWLGHENLQTTKSLYVHSTFEESLERFRILEAELA